MLPTAVPFTQGAFLVEVEPDFRDCQDPFVVYLSLLEDNGTVLRPLVTQEGDRFVVHGQTEPLAWRSALRYLRRNFGELSGPQQPWRPNHMTWGQPIVVEG